MVVTAYQHSSLLTGNPLIAAVAISGWRSFISFTRVTVMCYKKRKDMTHVEMFGWFLIILMLLLLLSALFFHKLT